MKTLSILFLLLLTSCQVVVVDPPHKRIDDTQKRLDDIAYRVCMIEKERYYEACPESQHECAWTGCPLHPDFN